MFALLSSNKLRERLEKDGCPVDDAAVKKLMLSVDEEFLNTSQSSGSTGTMCIVHKPEPGSTKHKLRVINIGDSRVVLGKKDGSLVDGGGTDMGLTTDHKPDHPIEKERIYRCGGTVECTEGGGVARVNGDLAVSRSFGDRDYKTTVARGPDDLGFGMHWWIECAEEHQVYLITFTRKVAEGEDNMLIRCDAKENDPTSLSSRE